MLLTLVMVNVQALQLKRFDEKTPYIQENLGLAKLINFYHKSYFRININSFKIGLQDLISNTYFLSLKINQNSSSFNLLKQLENRVEIVQNKLKLITHEKSKRSIFDGLGTVIRYITGNLDQDDLKNIINNMNKLRNNEENIKIDNTRYISLLSKLEEKFENNSLIISNNFKETRSKLQQLDTTANIQQAVLIELLYLEAYEQFLSTLLTTITLSLKEEVNLAIISYKELAQIYNLLKTLFSPEELIPFDDLHYFEILNACKLNTIISNSEIIFVLKIPILHIPTYNHQKIYPLVFKKNHYLMLPTHNVIENRRINFLLEPCIQLSSIALCKDIIKNECNLKTLENCTVVKIDNVLDVRKLKNNSILINTNIETKLFDNCNKQELIINQPTLVLEACKLEIGKEHYNSINTSTNIKIPKFNISIVKSSIIKIDELKSFDDVKQILKESAFTKQLQNIEWKHQTSWFSVPLCIFIIITLYVVFKNRKAIGQLLIRRKIAEDLKIEGQTVPLQEISEIRIYPSLQQEFQT